MEYDNNKITDVPMTDLAKNIKRQRTLIEDNVRQMTDDIHYFLMSYFERSGNDEISLIKNPFKNKCGNTITGIYLTKDNKILVSGLSYDFELSNVKPIEQALLFEHIVEQLSNACVYVVLEERYDPMDATRTRIVGTFKHIENAQECLEATVKEAQSKYPEMWEEYLKEGRTKSTNNKNEYAMCSSSYYYNIKVVEQVLEDEEW